MEQKGEVLYEISPKFEFLYELTTPMGRKMKSSFIAAIVGVIINILMGICKGYILNTNNIMIKNIYSVCSVIAIILLVVFIIVFIARVLYQILEYKGIKYKFYKDCLVCENTFLSQTKKTIEYSNIREVEIRRTFLDRIMNFGVIIIYTNADKTFESATVLYAVKNTVEKYNNIESLIHNKNISSGPIKVENDEIDNEISNTNPVEEYTQDASNDINPISENK